MALDFLYYDYYNNYYYYSNVMFLKIVLLFTQIVNDLLALAFWVGGGWRWWGWREGRELSTPDYTGQSVETTKN